MDKLKDLTLGEKIVAAAGALLLIDSFLPWYSVDIGSAFGVSYSYTRSGWQSPGALWSMLAVLLGVAMAAQVIVSKLGLAELPEKLGNFSWGQVHMFGGIAVLALVVIKFIGESDYVGFGMWIGFLCGAGLAFGGFTINKERSSAA
ncbi:MAG: hypothetical protein M5T61_08380 [Acidimicrobiia bacterium]|nr:hypothetical protein [Acidimicrobiia bacterium]